MAATKSTKATKTAPKQSAQSSKAKAAKKAAQVEAERQKRIQKLERGRLDPVVMFKSPNVPEGKYTAWDNDGIPTLDEEGKELSKNQVKKAQKDWQAQKKLHEEFLKWQAEGGQ